MSRIRGRLPAVKSGDILVEYYWETHDGILGDDVSDGDEAQIGLVWLPSQCLRSQIDRYYLIHDLERHTFRPYELYMQPYISTYDLCE